MKAKDETTTARAPSNRGRPKAESSIVQVEVIKAHDGIAAGEVFMKPRDIAMTMIAKGYYKQVVDE